MSIELAKIALQKEIALQVLSTVRNHCGNATLAGGAPRDWFLGKACRDLDVYVKGFNTFTYEALLNIGATKLGATSENYKQMVKDKLIRVCLAWEFDGLPVNIIFLDECTGNVYDHFDTSICKIAWLDGTNTFVLSDEFSKTLETKVIKFYTKADKYLLKIIEKFGKEYTFDFSEVTK